MYELEYTESALKQLNKLDQNTKERIINALERLKIRPQDYDIKKLVGSSAYRFRVGDYRVIFDMNNNKLTILILKVAHRKNVYDF